MENKNIYKVKGTVTAEDIQNQDVLSKVKDSLRQDSIPKTVEPFITDNIFAGGTPGDSPNE